MNATLKGRPNAGNPLVRVGLALMAMAWASGAWAEGAAMTVKSVANPRVWQLAADAESTVWQLWPDEATCANVSVTDEKGRAVAGFGSVTRGANGLWWSLDLPAREATTRLYDIRIDYLGSSSATTPLLTKTARVVRPATAIDVECVGSRTWRRIKAESPRVYAYDSAWADSAGAATVTLTRSGEETPLALAAHAGWASSRSLLGALGAPGPFHAEIAFGGVPYDGSDLTYVGGLMVIVQ